MMEGKTIEKVGTVSKEVAGKMGNESLAIVVAGLIVVVSVVTLGGEAKDIALAVGGGLVGYLSRTS